MIERLQKAAEDERAKSNSFIQEVESLSNMFGEVESENKRLAKQLSEKDSMLSKVMAERLRGRQLLTTIREENRALSQGRELDGSKIKQLTAGVAASKKMAQEATCCSNKGQEEIRILSSTLGKRRRIADDATKNLRSATAEKDEMKRERDSYIKRNEELSIKMKEDLFENKRLKEKRNEMELKIKELENRNDKYKKDIHELTLTLKQRNSNDNDNGNGNNGNGSNGDDIIKLKDGIIDGMRKRLYCSVVTNEEKAIVLLRCGHLFSRKCTDNLISTRNRKCPICGKPFGNDDVRSVFF